MQGAHDEFFLDMFEDQFNHERVSGRQEQKSSKLDIQKFVPMFVAISSEDSLPDDGCLYAPPTNGHAPHRDRLHPSSAVRRKRKGHERNEGVLCDKNAESAVAERGGV